MGPDGNSSVLRSLIVPPLRYDSAGQALLALLRMPKEYIGICHGRSRAAFGADGMARSS